MNVPVFAPVAVLVAVAAVGALLLIVRERRRQEVFARENARLLAEAQVRER